MKKLLLFSYLFIILAFINNVSAQGLLDKIKDKTRQRADAKTDAAIDKGLDKTEDATKNGANNSNNSANNNSSTNSDNSTTATIAAPTLKVYQNYDFVPGDKILFEDHFTDDQDGEFPAHWQLKTGQGVLNKLQGYEAFKVSDGDFAIVNPRLKTANYLTSDFTVEFDHYLAPNAYGTMIFFYKAGENDWSASVSINGHEAVYDNGGSSINLNATFPSEIEGDNYEGKWHHIAIVHKGEQLKVYVDQFRVLVVPDMGIKPVSIAMGGNAGHDAPLIFTNFKLAEGGGMNMIGKKFTEAKIVTHGINFDIDKATIKPESMGTLNMIVQVMKDNPDIKFEVDGHTDNTGTAAHNLTLSQQRADAVKDQLIKLGVSSSRLSSKGFGDTKPISDNSTFDGKANNRRVEFVKM